MAKNVSAVRTVLPAKALADAAPHVKIRRTEMIIYEKMSRNGERDSCTDSAH